MLCSRLLLVIHCTNSVVAQMANNPPAMQEAWFNPWVGKIPCNAGGLGSIPGSGRSPAMQEAWGQPLGWEDPLKKGKATHSTILGWRIPWPEEPGGLQPMGSDTTERRTLSWSPKRDPNHVYTSIPNSLSILSPAPHQTSATLSVRRQVLTC